MGVYLWLSGDNRESVDRRKVLYVGKAKNLRSRVRSYLNAADHKTRFLMKKAADIDWIVVKSEVEALLLESNLIKKHEPQYNIRLKDDKRYPYLCLTTGEPFPRLVIARRKQNLKHSYFGPYSDVRAARAALPARRASPGSTLPARRAAHRGTGPSQGQR